MKKAQFCIMDMNPISFYINVFHLVLARFMFSKPDGCVQHVNIMFKYVVLLESSDYLNPLYVYVNNIQYMYIAVSNI